MVSEHASGVSARPGHFLINIAHAMVLLLAGRSLDQLDQLALLLLGQ